MWTVDRVLVIALVLAALAPACDAKSGASPVSSGSASTSADSKSPFDDILARLHSAEHRRDSHAVPAAELAHSDPIVRRASTRALARIADAKAAEALLGRLRDEDAEVVVWAAYGMGYTCKGREAQFVPALALRGASWVLRPEHGNKQAVEQLEPVFAIAQALARCGSSDAEATLRAWLDQPALAEQASLALGNLAGAHQRLSDASIVALLDAASEPKLAPKHALYAFSRLGAVSPTVQARLLEVAVRALDDKGLARTFAIRALGSAGADASLPLERVLTDAGAPASERSAASRALRQLGEAGQQALGRALTRMVPLARQPEQLLGESFGPLLTTLEGLLGPVPAANAALREIAELPLSQELAQPIQRRLVRLRCAAAALLAGRASASERLVRCDPDGVGEIGQLAKLSVLDRGALTGARLRSWRRLLESKQPLVEQAALRMLSAHPEVPSQYRLLAQALGSKHPGTVATAAQVLANYPERAGAEPGGAGHADAAGASPHASIIEAFRDTLERNHDKLSVEVLAALMDAAGALQLLSAKSVLERYCTSDQPTLREHAEKALSLLGDKARSCDSFKPAESLPQEVAAAVHLDEPVLLAFDTDVGELTMKLDPRWAPVAVARVVELARAGYYDAMQVHRVVPGFVVQFGDKGGDGFGDAGREPIRCETSPVAFEPYQVGMALAGRDTASSQVFVTLDRFPRLDGNYAWLGSAGPEWQRLAQGDRIVRVSVR